MELPIWLVILAALFAVISLTERALIPPVRWYFRRRMERVVAKLNTRLERPIEPFKLARRHDMIQRLIYDPEVTAAVAEHAQTEGVPENVAFDIAQRYAREIVPSFSATAYFRLGTGGARWLSRALYRVRMGHYDRALSKIDPEATVIFVMNHRSNMDYVLVTYLAAKQSALSYAVGEWARVWPLSRLIKAMGAYFIRRRSRNALYRRVLARYVQMATAGGVTQAIFPEGGLSLDGRLAPPKLGLLSYVLSGFDPDAGRDVVFIPVALNYDRVLEDRILIAAGQRGDRKFRPQMSVVGRFVLKQLWLRVTGRFFRFGYAAVSFGQPVSLREYTKGSAPDPEEFAKNLMTRIGEVMPILPVPLVARVLLDAEKPLDRGEIEMRASEFVSSHAHGHFHLPRNSPEYAIEVGLRTLLLREMVQKEEDSYSTAPDQKPALEFYAASISHLQRK